MSAARDLAKLGNQDALTVDTTLTRVGINSSSPTTTLDIDGTVNVGTGVTVYSDSGIVSATKYYADSYYGSGVNLTGVGNTDNIITGTAATFNNKVNINSTLTCSEGINVSVGVITAPSASFSGNVTIGGTLTYEDVTDIDAVGLITARTGVRVTAGGLVVTAGVSTFSAPVNINSSPNFSEGLNVSAGVATFAGNQTVAGTAAFAQKTTVNATLDATEGLHVSAGVATFADALKVGTGASIFSPSSNILTLGTNSVEGLRLDASGRLIIGHTTSDDRDGYQSSLQVSGTGGDDSSASLGRWSADASSAGLVLSKSRNATPGSHTVVQADDILGIVQFQGDDGTNYHVGAQIQADVVSGVGNDDMPADLVFKTNSGSTSTTERLRLTSKGGLQLANGELIERCNISSTALNSDQVCNIDDGMVHYRTSNLGGSGGTSLDIMSSVGLSTAMATGDMMSFTLIHAVNATGNYVDHVNIDGYTITENWVGGSAPSAGGGSGVDIYTFNIIKKASGTGDTGFTVIGNHIKTS